jgi:hypothetical protein
MGGTCGMHGSNEKACSLSASCNIRIYKYNELCVLLNHVHLISVEWEKSWLLIASSI